MRKGCEAGRFVGRAKSKTIVIRTQKSRGHGCEVMQERLEGDRVCRASGTTVNGALWHPRVIRTAGRGTPGQGCLEVSAQC